MKTIETIPGILKHLATLPDREDAFNDFHKKQWRSLSTSEFLRQVKLATLAFVSLGLNRGESVGIISSPSTLWTILDFAIITAGGVTVPLFANIAEENFAFQIKQAKVRKAFLSGKDPWSMYAKHKSHFDQVFHLGHDQHEHLENWDAFLKRGEAYEKEHPDLYEELLNRPDTHDLATIVYTSGSTGVPKGAELTHRNLVSMTYQEAFYWDGEKDIYLNLLPLAHIFGRTLNIIILTSGVPVYYLNELSRVGQVCQQLHPTILVVVPRLLEKVYAKMLTKVEHAGLLSRTVGLWAFELASTEEHSLIEQMLQPVADTAVYSSLREALGGSLRIVITGGAAMNPQLHQFFLQIGVPVYEGWGMTEGCPAITNRPNRNKVGTIGPPLPSIDVKISPQGEILVRGPVVMRGYHKNPKETALSLDEERWLHTGDKGSIDEDGYVKIVGRLKDMFKTSGGKYVVPTPIEQELCQAPLIDWAMVIANQRKFASCLLFPNFEILHSLKKEHGKSSMTDQEFLHSDFVGKEMKKVLDHINGKLNHWEQVREYRFVAHTLSIDAGELTPSMKICRGRVEKKFSKEINSMYPEEKGL